MPFIAPFVQIRVYIKCQSVGKVLLAGEQVWERELVIAKFVPFTGSCLNTMNPKHGYLAPSLATDE